MMHFLPVTILTLISITPVCLLLSPDSSLMISFHNGLEGNKISPELGPHVKSGPTLLPGSSGSSDPDVLLQRCYGRWGCFSIGEPFLSIYRPVNLFPLHPDVLDVKFFLKTRRNPDVFQRLRPDQNETFIKQYNFDPSQPVKFLIHGYLEHGHQKWMQDMIRELLTKEDYNVISVDWVFGAAPPYTQAAANARMVGVIVADFINVLKDVYRIPLSTMHVIGHSLGAHVAGYAGERLKGLGRITGLDPAEPYFQYTLEEVRLDPTDADFVDVIHTDGGSLLTGDYFNYFCRMDWRPKVLTNNAMQKFKTADKSLDICMLGLGMIQDCGHVDFYPNGGKRQPGCNHNMMGAIEKEGDLLYGIRRFIGCNHIRAYEFFSESINSDCPFFGYVCDTYENFSQGKCPWGCGSDGALCAAMGLKASKWKAFAGPESIKMFLHTSNMEPFCRHHYFIRLRCSYSEESRMHTTEKGRLFIRLTGTKAQSPVLEAKKEYIQFMPGGSIDFLISASEMGRLLRVDLEWRSTASLLNPLTWRLFNVPQVYVKDVLVTHLETRNVTVFCGREEALIPHTIKSMFSDQTCIATVSMKEEAKSEALVK